MLSGKLPQERPWGSSSPNLLVVRLGWSIVTVRANPADRVAIEQFLSARLSPGQSEAEQPNADPRDSARNTADMRQW